VTVPWAVWGFFKLITPFIDPLTRSKMKFNEDLRQHVPPEQLVSGFGGDVDFEYDHAVYWPALVKLAETRRGEYRDRWVKGGKRVGEHEGYLRGQGTKSLSEIEGGQQAASLPDNSEKIPEVVPAGEALKVSAE
jgi:CRAL/TRIO domain